MAGSFCVRLGVGGLGVSGAVCVCDCGVVLCWGGLAGAQSVLGPRDLGVRLAEGV